MTSSGIYTSISLILLSMMFFLPAVSGEQISDSSDIDIDRYVTLEIVFDEGDHLELEAVITSSRDPISVYLIKGEEDLEDFKRTEEVDIQAIKEGRNVSGNNTFRAISKFSEQNVTGFSESITIGEKDTYYLVIIIHRERGMSKQEVFALGTRVTYDVEWKEVSDDVPWFLLPIAIILFLIGLSFIIAYYKMSKREKAEESIEETGSGGNREIRRNPRPGERMRGKPPSRYRER